ncbi:MAG: hypothetical protein K2W33_15070 [Burkholderiales bacterium]|nr:hypothetical protein [Burkholderiales bacterium]
MYRYEIDQGDGRWLLLNKQGTVAHSTTGTELSFAYDRDCGTLHKHGSTPMVDSWLKNTQGNLNRGGASDLADALQILTVNSYPLVGIPQPGVLYMSVEDANACISTSGYILRVIAKLNAIDVDVIDVTAVEVPGT